MQQETTILNVEQLEYTYADGTAAVKAINFEVGAGRSVGIVGGNGAGKSTLLLLLCGLLEPDQGRVWIGNEKMDKKSFKRLSSKIGFVFQNAEDQLFTNSVYEDIAYGPKHAGLSSEEIDKLVCQASEAVQINHLLKRAPHKLSGGEKRLAALATALVFDPELLILDEPTTGLDPMARRNLITLLNRFDHTRLVTSHDMDFIYEVCDLTILMKDGELIAYGPTQEILSNQNLLASCRLELPLKLQGCSKCSAIKK